MITIKDVAKAAQISITTVSRALNDYDDVNQETKERIQRIAKELGYVANRSAQNLVMKKNNTLAIILSGLERDGGKDNIVYRLLSGMYQYAEQVNYEVVLFTTSSAHQREKTYVQFCKEHNIGGAVLNGIRLDDPYLQELMNSDLPCVLIDIDAEGNKVSSVTIDNEQAAYEAVTYLINANHKHIAMMNGRKEAAVSIERFAGYKRALVEKNIPYDESMVLFADFLEQRAMEMAYDFLLNKPEVTAFFCASDMMALGVIKAAKQLKVKVPEKLSVVGFDNIPLSEHSFPALTTVDQDFYQMGQEAARQLLKLIHNEAGNKKIILSHKLLARESVSVL